MIAAEVMRTAWVSPYRESTEEGTGGGRWVKDDCWAINGGMGDCFMQIDLCFAGG